MNKTETPWMRRIVTVWGVRVVVEFAYHWGYPGSYWEPPDEPEVELHDWQLVDFPHDAAIDFEDAIDHAIHALMHRERQAALDDAAIENRNEPREWGDGA